MDQSLCKLTLIYPPASETHLVEVLLNSEPAVSGFTTWEAEAHGQSFAEASMRERVRGRITRGVLMVVLPRARIELLVEEIRVKAAIADLVYWIEPVLAFGRMRPVVARASADEHAD